MTATHFDVPPALRPALLVSLLTWLWPEPLRSKRRRVGALWWFALVAAIWPRPLQRDFTRAEPTGRGGRLFSYTLDRFLSRWWRVSWLWAWMWPGRLMGPDGEICPLVPWHPALQAQVCDAVPCRRRTSRRGMVAGMMMLAATLAVPTLMGGNSALDGGRLSAFLGGGSAGSGGAGDQGSGGGGAGDPGAGSGQTGPMTTFNPGNLTPPETQNYGFDPGQSPLAGGGTGAGSGGAVGPTGGEGGLTFLDPPAGGDGLGFGFGGGSGGGAGGGSGGIGGGGGGGGPGPGGGDLPTGPGEETPKPGDDPFGPPDTPDDPFEMPNDGPAPTAGSPGGPAGPGSPFGGGGSGSIPLFAGPPVGGAGPLDAPLAPVPEPQTWAMMILGFGAVGYLIRRRRASSLVQA
ncbi:PEPxxWA-CTERM sorting domain-containing protein [Phenylobacterium sp.]|uniref:PEPxxWA-CTERM sorting domain-containing protein n=1 Tax=Phenylobacterium sp. TaxID=1871053 RepID=UPI0037C537E2